MKVLVVEPNADGHHIALYLRCILLKLKHEECSISLLVSLAVLHHKSFKSLPKELLSGVKTHLMETEVGCGSNSSFTLFLRQLRYWQKTKRGYLEAVRNDGPPDLVYVPTLDFIAKAVELIGSPFRSTPFVALYMAPKHHLKSLGLAPGSRGDLIYTLLFGRLLKLKSLKALLVIDKHFYDFCLLNYGKFSAKIEYVPDFGRIHGCLPRESCRERLGVSNSDKLILVYGYLTARKGIIQLLDAMMHPGMHSSIKVVIAGNLDTEMEGRIFSNRYKSLFDNQKILVRSFFHSDDEEHLVFNASDFVWLGYTHRFFGSSGVLFKAASAKVPVIAMDRGLISRIVNENQLGLCVNPLSTSSIVAGISTILLTSEHSFGNSKSTINFLKEHSCERHAEILYKTLLKSCGS
jgi:glycosyltransferase involved in cell wall biosynthesis